MFCCVVFIDVCNKSRSNDRQTNIYLSLVKLSFGGDMFFDSYFDGILVLCFKVSRKTIKVEHLTQGNNLLNFAGIIASRNTRSQL